MGVSLWWWVHGLMGAVASGCATNGGYVHGIIPEALISRERTVDEEAFNTKLKSSIDNHDGSTQFLILNNMAKQH